MTQSVLTVSGLDAFVEATGPVDPFATIGLTGTQPDLVYNFAIDVAGGAIIGAPDGLDMLSETADPSMPGAMDGYVIQATAAQLAAYLSTGFELAFDPGQTRMEAELFVGANVPGQHPAFAGTAAERGFVDVTAACYLRGTHIATPTGERAIESLAVGEIVTLADGGTAPICWIGIRTQQRPPAHALPVCILAGAIAPGIPSRDLFVSPHHAMLIDGVLIPAVTLINGCSIRRCGILPRVDYLHLELRSHAALLANGTPSESYADCDNRWMFDNADIHAVPRPEAGRRRFCAPRCESGPLHDAIHARLAARAKALPRPRGLALRRVTLRSAGTAITLDAADPRLVGCVAAARAGLAWPEIGAVLPATLLSALPKPVCVEMVAVSMAGLGGPADAGPGFGAASDAARTSRDARA